jgi:hypothetical protein
MTENLMDIVHKINEIINNNNSGLKSTQNAPTFIVPRFYTKLLFVSIIKFPKIPQFITVCAIITYKKLFPFNNIV